MPGGLPIGLELGNCSFTGATNSKGVQVDPSATANTKGAYVQLIAATASDFCWVLAEPNNGDSVPYSCDIAIGASGSEKVILPDMFCQASTSERITQPFSFPLNIQAGTRVAARSQCSAASHTGSFFVAFMAWDGGNAQMEGCAGMDALGFNSGTTTGTTVTSAASVDGKGSYAQIIASTAKDYTGLIMALGAPPSASMNICFDIAVGASGSEIMLVKNYEVTLTSPISGGNFIYSPPVSPAFFVPVQAGSRLAVRAQDSNGAGNSFGVVLYGIYQ